MGSLDAVRFSKICEMLTSSHDGERAVAAAKATSMLREAGLTWTDLVTRAMTRKGSGVPYVDELERACRRAAQEAAARPPPPPQPPREPPPARFNRRFGLDAAELLQLIDLQRKLSDWERKFLTSLIERNRLSRRRKQKLELTDRQWDHLIRIALDQSVIKEEDLEDEDQAA